MFASAFILSLLIALQLSSSLGSCSSPVFSVCWVLNVSASAKRPDTKIWLDSNELTPIGSKGKLVSLIVTTLDVHTLRADYEGISHVWNFSVVSDSINVTSAHRTAYLPPSRSGEALKAFQPNEVFPCENDTHYLYQKEDFIIALGHTHRFPLRAESRGASTLLVSWRGSHHVPPDPLHRVVLYRPDLDGLAVLCNETTRRGHYRFAGLDGCRSYVACVEMALGPAALCLTALTGPGEVLDLRFRQKDSIALWSGRSGVGVAFLYRLSERGGPSVRKGRLAGPPLPLPGLRPGSPYDLEVVPECEGGERGAPAVLYFIPEEVPGSAPNDAPGDILLPRVVDSADQTTDRLGLQVHPPSHEMFLVVPWTMPPSLEDPRAEARVLLEGIIKSKDGVVILRPEEQLQHIISLGHAHITVTDDSIYWDDADECDSPALNKCSSNSVCINTLDSFTCVCEPGYYSLSPILSPACHEKGMFTLCLKDHVSGGISKPFLIHYFGGNVTVVLNDGRCSINETDMFYYYRITGAPSQCGGQTLINRTHVELRNALTVTLSSGRSITRRDLKVLWTCAYPLLQTSTARMKPGLDWVTSHSVVQVNSSRLLEISMALYSDSSYAYNYTGPVELPSAEQLYIQVTLHCENSLAYNMSLQLESCWATQTADPQEEKKAFFLKGGCPNDRTFRWYLRSSSPQRKRFSVQMFTMSDHSHIYLHCLSRICSQDENCTTVTPHHCKLYTMNCSPRQNQKVRRDLLDKLTAILSAGPISAAKRKLTNWPGAQIMLSVAGGLIGLFFLTALGVRAAHAITQHNPRHQ
ncbi:uncharacterized protein LOC118218895 isoform X8 [Anguilla anguilla]|uniref:uncharacterized protein LOC118218895 isoform X8 n=1 Tax=Anguilla anguilla TaxID=7936 RepID=UPI0015AEC554|nr:uncharacterized protein LOC118218895 isoform X8 [Anguilla anguilla]